MPVTECVRSIFTFTFNRLHNWVHRNRQVTVWCSTMVGILHPGPLTDIQKLLIHYESNMLNLVNKANLVHNLLDTLISFPYVFRATMCPSSGEITVFMRHLVLVILYGRLSGIQGGMTPCVPDSRPHRVTNTMFRIDTVISPDDGHKVARNM